MKCKFCNENPVDIDDQCLTCKMMHDHEARECACAYDGGPMAVMRSKLRDITEVYFPVLQANPSPSNLDAMLEEWQSIYPLMEHFDERQKI